VHLLANGIRLDPYEANPQALLFRIPVGTESLRLKSRTSSPCELGLSSDNRQLGFCLHSLSSHSEDGTFRLSLAPNHTKLLEGFYPAEGTVRRWTQGDALLPIALLDEGTEEMILTLKGRSLDRYHLSDTETLEIEPIPKPQLSVSRLNA